MGLCINTNTPPGDSGGWVGACEEEVDGEAQPRPARPANPHLTEPDRKGGTRVHQAPCPSLPEPATPGVSQQFLQDEGNGHLTLAEPDWERQRQE